MVLSHETFARACGVAVCDIRWDDTNGVLFNDYTYPNCGDDL